MRTHLCGVRLPISAVLISTTLTIGACSDSTAPAIPKGYIVNASKTTASVGDTVILQAQLVDANDHGVPASGRRVSWYVSGSNGQFTSAQSITAGNGVATNYFIVGSKPGVNVAITVIDEKQLTGAAPTITVVVGPPSVYAVTSSSSSALVGTTVSLSAQLTDKFGNPTGVAGRVVTWSIADNSGGYYYEMGARTNRPRARAPARLQNASSGFSSPTSTTNSGGLATVEFAVGTTIESYVITVKDDQAIAGSSAPITVQAGPIAKLVVTVSATDPPAGGAVTLAASGTDAYGNNVTTPGISVTWSVTGGGVLRAALTTTDQNGVATNVLTTSSSPGSYTVSASSGSQASATSPVITSLRPMSLVSLATSFGAESSCGLADDATVWCWGAQDASRATRPLPGLPVGGQTMSMVSTSGVFTCGISTGTVLCWGANNMGQLGDNSRTDRAAPAPINSSLSFTAVSTGSQHACALATTGDIYCWGLAESGRLGDGTGFSGLGPIKVAANVAFAAVSAGGAHTCAIATTGDVYCWGLNARGQVGNGSASDAPTPVLVPGGFKFTAIATGNSHTCGVAAGVVYCWGDNTFGEVGNGSTSQYDLGPASIKSTSTFATVTAGAFHSCAITVDGKAYCWGDNTTGELGDPNFTQARANVPIAVTGGLIFKSIVAGGDGSLANDYYDGPYASGHTCGLTTDGSAYCWGSNNSGELGIGTFTAPTATPTKVTGQR